MIIHLESRPSIGRPLFWPICSNSAVMLAVMEKKSFTEAQVKLMRKMGWEVEIIKESEKLLTGRKAHKSMKSDSD